ncbi:fungal-specific transcription factor domain-containing protein [Pseudomassariella vexata]|uniref:Fungal-specific transcription factor domain-domain-containing protein n=1 Tax=Pseudomassariella vexata TaxID=1141098 RepID=A0A1Y2DVV7_9PEZI|nr:fungal-specific transcription factor domain-containing protein [Pseudomassariella vexata]ORY63411.1 fungal-specific transcription factor domain-domain-containing protein [Pseudomassariella vexata]
MSGHEPSDINQVPVEDLTPEEASRIIHSHRKVRYGTACWPCRQRKVKCDNKQPCENCVKREHPQLCSYKPNRTNTAKPGSTSTEASLGKKRPHSPDDSVDHDHDHRHDHEHGSDHQSNGWPRALDSAESVEIPRYVGQNSIPALLRDQPSPIDTKDGIDIRRDMRPIWGLDNSAPFPLMSSHHLDRLTQEISAELPSDREIIKLFKSYKEVPHPFWGFVIDIDDLESRLMIYLEERAKSAKAAAPHARPTISASWLAILFSVLAVGSQYHDSPYHIRTRDSQKYLQISFHFLRLGNFLLRPNLDSIQALLMTSFVLLNDMKAEASWALLALTCRLAQSLGLHRTPPQDSRENSSTDMSVKDYVRRKLWWTCQWHDTLTSLSFDRPNMTNIQCCPIPLSPSSTVQGFSYLEAMYHLCQIISEKLNPDATAACTYDSIVENCREVESLRERVYPQLRSREALKTAVDRLQHYALRLHTSFVVSVCCRPALRSDCTSLDTDEKKTLAEKCRVNLTETVKMFLSMHNISVIPTRSWAFTYHGLSSAVLLGILTETKTDPEVRRLQGDLISALSAAAARDRSSPSPGHIRRSERDIELSGPLSRALTALKNIYDYGSLQGLSGLKSEVPSGSRTPNPPMQNMQNINPQLRVQPGLDPHQDAALAMAELQNGAGATLPDFAATIPYPPQMQQGVGVPDMSQMDPATYMSPMDLYDSIFWESPDPFYTGTDMNFDFMAQPPPGQPPQQQFYF